MAPTSSRCQLESESQTWSFWEKREGSRAQTWRSFSRPELATYAVTSSSGTEGRGGVLTYTGVNRMEGKVSLTRQM